MDKNTERKILAIATDVRNWADLYAEEHRMSQNLCGMCAIASAELWRELVDAKFKPIIGVWTDQEDIHWMVSHVFIKLDDYVLDVTATQFNGMEDIPVYFAHHRTAEARGKWYNHTHIFETPGHLIKWQKKTGWNINEIAWK